MSMGRSGRGLGRGMTTGSTITGGSSAVGDSKSGSGGEDDKSEERRFLSSLSLRMENLLDLRGLVEGEGVISEDVDKELPLAVLLVLALPNWSVTDFARSRLACL